MAFSSRTSVGSRIRQLRAERGVSVEELAQRIRTDKGTVSRIERGKAGIGVERLQRIAAALGTSVDSLLGNGETPSGSRVTRRAVA